MFIRKDNQKRCNPYAPYTDEQGTRYHQMPSYLYEEIAEDPRPEPTAGFTLDEEYDRAEDWNTTQRPYTLWTRKSQVQLDDLLVKKAKQQALVDARDYARADNVINYLRTHTPQECETYVQKNVTDLASAKALLKKFAIALCVISKQTFD